MERLLNGRGNEQCRFVRQGVEIEKKFVEISVCMFREDKPLHRAARFANHDSNFLSICSEVTTSPRLICSMLSISLDS